MHGDQGLEHRSHPQACDIRLRVVGDELIEAPVHEGAPDGRNWLAVIEPDPGAPDGLARIGLSPTPDGGFMLPGPLDAGTVLECGAERVGRAGQGVHRTVRYGVVVRHDERQLVLRPAADAVEALAGAAVFAAARLGRPAPAPPPPRPRRRGGGDGLPGVACDAEALVRRLEKLAGCGALGDDATCKARAAAAQVALAARMLRSCG